MPPQWLGQDQVGKIAGAKLFPWYKHRVLSVKSGLSCLCCSPFFTAGPLPESLKFTLLYLIALCMLVVVSLQDDLDPGMDNINNCKVLKFLSYFGR